MNIDLKNEPNIISDPHIEENESPSIKDCDKTIESQHSHTETEYENDQIP
jgi:hypothetical protein